MCLNLRVLIGWVIFSDFFSSNGQKQLVFSANDQIHIQMVKFKFKQTNQNASRHYQLPAPTVGGSAQPPGDSA
jgi:hypothetical protein